MPVFSLSIIIPKYLTLNDLITQLQSGARKLCFDNRLTYQFLQSLDKADGEAACFLTALSSATALKFFDASNADWDDNNPVAKGIFNALKNNDNVEQINITGNKFSTFEIIIQYVHEIKTHPNSALLRIQADHNGKSPTSGMNSSEVLAYRLLQKLVRSLKTKKIETSETEITLAIPDQSLSIVSSSSGISSECASIVENVVAVSLLAPKM